MERLPHVTEFLDALAATVNALHMPNRPEWTPIVGLLGLYAVLAAVSCLGHVAAANLGDRRYARARLDHARSACILGSITLGLALIAAGLPLGRFL